MYGLVTAPGIAVYGPPGVLLLYQLITIPPSVLWPLTLSVVLAGAQAGPAVDDAAVPATGIPVQTSPV